MKSFRHVFLLVSAVAVFGSGCDSDKGKPKTALPLSKQPSSTPSASSAQSKFLQKDPTCGLKNFQQEMLKQVNQARARSRICGTTRYAAAPPLVWNDKLAAAGMAHALDMGNQNYFSHTSQDGRAFSDRITEAGYRWREAGENIAAGQTSLEQVMNDWLKSPGHCANIMNPIYTEVGVSCIKNPDSLYKEYWGMEFGLPR